MTFEQLRLDNQLCFRLYAASRLITQAYEPYLHPLGITYTQYLVLMVLWEHDKQPINDIGKRLLLQVNTISPLIKRMERQGLLSRRDGTTDRRQQIIFLTPKGKALRQRAASIPKCMVNGFESSHLDMTRLTSMIPILDELIEKLSDKS